MFYLFYRQFVYLKGLKNIDFNSQKRRKIPGFQTNLLNFYPIEKGGQKNFPCEQRGGHKILEKEFEV